MSSATCDPLPPVEDRVGYGEGMTTATANTETSTVTLTLTHLQAESILAKLWMSTTNDWQDEEIMGTLYRAIRVLRDTPSPLCDTPRGKVTA